MAEDAAGPGSDWDCSLEVLESAAAQPAISQAGTAIAQGAGQAAAAAQPVLSEAGAAIAQGAGQAYAASADALNNIEIPLIKLS